MECITIRHAVRTAGIRAFWSKAQAVMWASSERAFVYCLLTADRGSIQGCSLGLERVGLNAVSRVWKIQTSRSLLGLEGSTSRLGLEDIMSRSRDFSLVNLLQACGYITKKIMDLTRKKQVVKWQTSPVSVFKLRHCGLDTFFGTSRSRSWRLNISSCLGLESLGKWNVLVPSWSWGFNVSVSSRSCDLTSCRHP